jgi:hypothetical protein
MRFWTFYCSDNAQLANEGMSNLIPPTKLRVLNPLVFLSSKRHLRRETCRVDTKIHACMYYDRHSKRAGDK